MPEKVIVSHRGSRYEIGRGKRYYGIWVAGAPESDPIDRWPETRDGWAQAWARFVAIESPGTIAPVPKQRTWLNVRIPGILPPKKGADPAQAGTGSARAGGGIRYLVAVGLLGLGVILGLAGLFLGYVGGQSLASQSDQLVPHLLYLAVWAAAAVTILLAFVRARTKPGATARVGALAGTGLSAVAFGMLFSDLGEVIAGAAAGAGLVLSLLGWLACTAGSVLALTVRDPKPPAAATAASRLVRPRAAESGPLVLLVLAAIGTVAAFIPSWDSYTLVQAVNGAAQTITAGNAFSNPGPVIVGNVAVMVALITVAVVAALWRPARNGAALLAGAIVPMVAQGISALIQVSGPVSPAQFNISQAEASALGLTINSGVTPIFWVYCVFVISLVISCAWMLTMPPHQAMPGRPWSPQGPLPPHHEMRDQDARRESDTAPADSDDTSGGSDQEHTDAALGNSGDGDSLQNAQGDEETTFASAPHTSETAIPTDPPPPSAGQ